MSDNGPDEESDLLEQYKFYAGTSNDVSNRRLRTNRFYVSLLSGILVALPFVLDLNDLTPIRLAAILIIGLVGVMLCVLWFFNILSYKQLNQGKYEVIHDMERELPYPCYKLEWENLGEGKDRCRYIPHWKVERWVPGLMSLPYFAMAIFAAYTLIT